MELGDLPNHKFSFNSPVSVAILAIMELGDLLWIVEAAHYESERSQSSL